MKTHSGLSARELAEVKRKYHREVYLRRKAKDPDYQKKSNEYRKKWLERKGDEAKDIVKEYNKKARANYVYNHGKKKLSDHQRNYRAKEREKRQAERYNNS